jgi:hypothetical protein
MKVEIEKFNGKVEDVHFIDDDKKEYFSVVKLGRYSSFWRNRKIFKK